MSSEALLAKVFSDRRRDPDGKREAILRTSVQLFLDDGYARTALNDIADKLKITKPALYHYFRNKEEILLECYRWGCLLIRESLDEISARGGAGLDKVSAFIRSYTEVIAVDFGRAVIRLDDGELSGEAQAEVRSYKREIDRRLRSFIQEGIDERSPLRALSTGSVCGTGLAARYRQNRLRKATLRSSPAGSATVTRRAQGGSQVLSQV
jgi:AcrR family transcriptional regulator